MKKETKKQETKMENKNKKFFGKKEKQKSVSNIYGKTWNFEFFIFVSQFHPWWPWLSKCIIIITY